jgi:hypothetical protein
LVGGSERDVVVGSDARAGVALGALLRAIIIGLRLFEIAAFRNWAASCGPGPRCPATGTTAPRAITLGSITLGAEELHPVADDPEF